jgi:hypothetical protein
MTLHSEENRGLYFHLMENGLSSVPISKVIPTFMPYL